MPSCWLNPFHSESLTISYNADDVKEMYGCHQSPSQAITQQKYPYEDTFIGNPFGHVLQAQYFKDTVDPTLFSSSTHSSMPPRNVRDSQATLCSSDTMRTPRPGSTNESDPFSNAYGGDQLLMNNCTFSGHFFDLHK